MVDDLQTDPSFEPGVDRRSREVNSNTQAGKRTFTLNASSQSSIRWDVYIFSCPSKDEFTSRKFKTGSSNLALGA
jgi:hypothetical protein